jgi:hypothetical protein
VHVQDQEAILPVSDHAREVRFMVKKVHLGIKKVRFTAACKNVDVNSNAREGLLAAPLRHSSGHFASTFVTTAVGTRTVLEVEGLLAGGGGEVA